MIDLSKRSSCRVCSQKGTTIVTKLFWMESNDKTESHTSEIGEKNHADLRKTLGAIYKRLTIKGMSTKNTLNTKLNVNSNPNTLNLGIIQSVFSFDEKARHPNTFISYL